MHPCHALTGVPLTSWRVLSIGPWLSNVKWFILSLRRSHESVQNWWSLAAFALSPLRRRPFVLRLTSGLTLEIPPNYLVEGLAETLFLNVYGLPSSRLKVTVDIGASIGDFTMVAALRSDVVYAFEADEFARNNLIQNLARSGVKNVVVSERPATTESVTNLFKEFGIAQVDFLKVDCEGCEYDVLPEMPRDTLVRFAVVAMELHPLLREKHPDLSVIFSDSGFDVRLYKVAGGPYLRAERKSGASNCEIPVSQAR